MVEQPRFQSPDVRRRQILDAALALTEEEGFARVSIARVAQEAGIAKGTIYLYFASREELAAALLTDFMDQMSSEAAEIVADEARTWTQRLDDVVSAWVRFELAHHATYHEILYLVEPTHDTDPFGSGRSLLSSLLAGGAQAGEFDVPDMNIATDFLLHGYAGPCHHADGVPQEAVVAEVQRLFRRAVGAG